MLVFLAVCTLALALPPVLRLLRGLALLHLRLLALLLPAGLLLRFGGVEDLAVLALVTLAWGACLAGRWLGRRSRARRAERWTRCRRCGPRYAHVR